jgi:hypothetical protein
MRLLPWQMVDPSVQTLWTATKTSAFWMRLSDPARPALGFNSKKKRENITSLGQLSKLGQGMFVFSNGEMLF